MAFFVFARTTGVTGLRGGLGGKGLEGTFGVTFYKGWPHYFFMFVFLSHIGVRNLKKELRGELYFDGVEQYRGETARSIGAITLFCSYT